MNKVYYLPFLLAVNYFSGQNSQLYDSRIFLNEKEKPQNFLKVLNKNSGVYEFTDEEGFAIIAAKQYDTLVWNNGKNKAVVYYPQELKSILENRVEKKNTENIQNKDYDSLIFRDLKDEFSIEKSSQRVTANSGFYAVRKLKEVSKDHFKLKMRSQKLLLFNGSFTTSVDVKNRNSVPETQNQYVQGRSEAGKLIWKGPETGEMFSFGPDISTLQFDNQPYEYDENGKLIPLTDGNFAAKAYQNDIFKTTVGYNNQLRLSAFIKSNEYKYDDLFRISLELGQQKDQAYFIDQYSILNSLKTKLSSKILKFSLNFVFSYDENKATNSNRIGLFNRVYQNSLLTPASFSNKQDAFLPNGLQRSYGQLADNPGFLFFQNNKYNYSTKRMQFNGAIVRNWNYIRFSIAQSYENDVFSNLDQYKPSTSGFPYGLRSERIQNNRLYNSNILLTYSPGEGDWRNTFSFNQIINNHESEIYNSLINTKYAYQRTSQDYIFEYKLNYEDYNDFEMGINIGNSFYISNTSLKNDYFLPKAAAYITFVNIFNLHHINFKILGTYTQQSSEPEITRSYASYATTLFNAQSSSEYFPLQEAESYNNLSNIDLKEWKAGFRLTSRNNLGVEAEYFSRKINNDVFPVFQNNLLKLKNLADHTYSGYEINFFYENIYLGPDFRMSQKASFFKYRDVVDRVDLGYNHLAVSGFRDIYKTISEGEVVGAVMGSYFKTNANGEIIIDESGYPEKAEGMKIIADPTPDFVVKFNHNFSYKMFSLDLNWEWKKGGQLWNGTQAVLDYYGRSKTSGDERNIKNYIFQGGNAAGNTNQVPVDFYDPGQDVSQNRWVRYGYLGVAENYVQKADYIRINTISLTAKFDFGKFKRALDITFYVNNIILWQANQGADSNQNFYDTDNGRGLDFFNLPSYKTLGCMVSFQF